QPHWWRLNHPLPQGAGMSQKPAKSKHAPPTTVLVADDDRAILGLVESVLKGAGYSVLLADGGRNAVEVFQKSTNPVHLLLTDVIMPDLTGPVVAERLRTIKPDLHVLFMSGFHDAELVQHFLTGRNF